MINIEISKKAEFDLQNIWDYTFKKHSKLQADRYINLFSKEFKLISKFPNIGISQDNIVAGYRSTIVKSHLIFYKISKTNSFQIVRILHQSMQIDNHL